MRLRTHSQNSRNRAFSPFKGSGGINRTSSFTGNAPNVKLVFIVLPVELVINVSSADFTRVFGLLISAIAVLSQPAPGTSL